MVLVQIFYAYMTVFVLVGYWPLGVWIGEYTSMSFIMWFLWLCLWWCISCYLFWELNPRLEDLFLALILGRWLSNIWISEYVFLSFIVFLLVMVYKLSFILRSQTLDLMTRFQLLSLDINYHVFELVNAYFFIIHYVFY